MENKQEELRKQAIEYYLQELYKKELNNEKMPIEAVEMYNILEGNVKVRVKQNDKYTFKNDFNGA